MTVELGELIAAGGALAGGMIWICKVFTNPLKETLTMVNSTLIELDKTIQGGARTPPRPGKGRAVYQRYNEREHAAYRRYRRAYREDNGGVNEE